MQKTAIGLSPADRVGSDRAKNAGNGFAVILHLEYDENRARETLLPMAGKENFSSHLEESLFHIPHYGHSHLSVRG
jgi:hypothetical protein